MQDISLEKLSLIGYDKINQSDEKEKTVHFFLDDYRFESIYKNPNDKIERLKKFNAVMSPDFSMFTGYVLPREKGGGSAGGIGAGNPKPTFDENRDMPKFPGYKNKSPGKGLNGGAARLRRIIKVIGIIEKPEKAITGM